MRTPILISLLLTAACLCQVGTADTPTAILVGDSAMVPMRAVFEWLNADIHYQSGRITAIRGTDTVSLAIGSRQATINGRPVTLAALPILRNGITYVPLRFVAESMGAGVEYDGARQRVTINRDGRTMILQIAARRSTSGNAAVDLACEVLAALLPVFDAETYRGRRIVFFPLKSHAWVREYVECWPPSEDDRLDRDPRFQSVLRRYGGKPGDRWYPYEGILVDDHCYQVTFPGWNSQWTIDTSGGFQEPHVEGIRYEMEVSEWSWQAEKVGGQWRFSQR